MVAEAAATSAARAEPVAVPLPVGDAEGCAEGELKDDSITVKKQQLEAHVEMNRAVALESHACGKTESDSLQA